MRKIWDKIVEWIQSIPADKKMHFVAGVIIAAFFALALGIKVTIVPAIFAGLIMWEWWDFAATCLGGLLIQIFILLGMWWGFA